MDEKVRLLAGDDMLEVDKDILMKNSDYFNAMFSTPFTEDCCNEVNLHNINFQTLKIIIGYFHTGRLQLRPSNIGNIFIASDFMQVKAIKKKCLQVLPTLVDPTNYTSLYNLSLTYGLKEVQIRAIDMMLYCFEQIFEDKDHLQMDINLFFTLLSSLELNISNELIVWKAICSWIGYKKSSRAEFFEQLVFCLQLNILTNDCLCKILRHPYMTSDLADSLRQKHKNLMNDCEGRVPKERFGMTNNRIYIIGGHTSHKISLSSSVSDFGKFIEFIDTDPSQNPHLVHPNKIKFRSKETLSYVLEQPAPHAFYGASGCYYKDSIYIAGGAESKDGKLWKFKSYSQQWQDLPSMKQRVQHTAVCCVDGQIYVIGGYEIRPDNSRAPSKQIQIYNIELGKWSENLELSEYRAHCSVIGIDRGGGLPGRIFVLGGYGQKPLNTVEVIQDKKIEPMASMIKKRYSFVAAMVEGKIFAVGGWQEQSVEIYDFRCKQWTLAQKFPRFRKCMQGATCNGKLYCFGGTVNNRYVDTIEEYDTSNGSWKSVGSLQLPRIYAAVVAT